MGQSLTKNYIHIVFSVKNRKPLIQESIEQELFRYIGGICKNLESTPLEVGGYRDHVHILCLLSKKMSLASLVEKVKSKSSKWIKPNSYIRKFTAAQNSPFHSQKYQYSIATFTSK